MTVLFVTSKLCSMLLLPKARSYHTNKKVKKILINWFKNLSRKNSPATVFNN